MLTGQKGVVSLENTVTAAQLGQILGVNLRTIQRMTQEGVLTWEPDPRDKRRKCYPLAESVQAYIQREVMKAAGSERKERIAELEEKKLAAETGLKESQRDLHQLKTEIASGKYLPVEQVQDDYASFFSVFKKFVQGIPARVTTIISGYADPAVIRGLEQSLSAEFDRQLQQFVVAGEVAGHEAV